MLENQGIIKETIAQLATAFQESHSETKKCLEKLLQKKKTTVCGRPPILPFTTVDDIERFESVDEDTYDSVVNYFAYLGGLTIQDCATSFMIESLELSSELLRKITWRGLGNKFKLADTNFAKACEDAMNRNKHFKDVTEVDFNEAMKKALKSYKERLRRKVTKRSPSESDEEQQPQKRSRVTFQSEDVNLGNEEQQQHQNHDAMTPDDDEDFVDTDVFANRPNENASYGDGLDEDETYGDGLDGDGLDGYGLDGYGLNVDGLDGNELDQGAEESQEDIFEDLSQV